VTRISELGTTLAVTSKWRTLVFLRSLRRLLVTARVVPSSPIPVLHQGDKNGWGAKFIRNVGSYKIHTA
jgi:hypothetical protein